MFSVALSLCCSCLACNCNGHSNQCRFDPFVYEDTNRTSGGVCLNCSNNRAGRNCERCAEFFYPEGPSSNFNCTGKAWDSISLNAVHLVLYSTAKNLIYATLYFLANRNL